VLQNLVGNALKFRSEAPPRVHISAQCQGAEWVISVRDNGIGLDPHQAQRIFIIFQRLHTLREYPGTGLGLTICKRIIEQHRGRIWVDSEPGRGATFSFTLPTLSGTG
jgi:chemotaxis family two-component system sensor kinase Cph1